MVVPDEARREAQAAIEHAADLIAVTQGTRRSIASAWPPVALSADGDDGRAWLQQARFIDFSGEYQGRSSMTASIELTDEVQRGLRDRLDGVALLAEALAHAHATGQFHEFGRLFERAFAVPMSKVAGPLTAFLRPKFGYTDDEVKHWTETLRDLATHADVRPSFVLESDIRPVIARIQQAAYDVLLDKQSWRSSDPARRELWSPPAGTTSASGDMFIVQGSEGVAMQDQLTEPLAGIRSISQPGCRRFPRAGGSKSALNGPAAGSRLTILGVSEFRGWLTPAKACDDESAPSTSSRRAAFSSSSRRSVCR